MNIESSSLPVMYAYMRMRFFPGCKVVRVTDLTAMFKNKTRVGPTIFRKVSIHPSAGDFCGSSTRHDQLAKFSDGTEFEPITLRHYFCGSNQIRIFNGGRDIQRGLEAGTENSCTAWRVRLRECRMVGVYH